jgi:hypothetical protein
MRNTSLMCLILFCLFSKTSSAQVYIDLVNAGFSQNLKTKYKGFDNNYQQQTTWFNANVPFVFNDKGDFLLPNLQYSFTTLQHDFFEEDELRFHNTNLGLSWLKNWKNPYWASYLDLGTGISSDLKNVKDEHYNYTATLLFYYGKKKELVWNFGGNYTGGAFGNYIVPMFGVDWMINDKATLSFQTFSHLQLDYQLTPKIYTGIVAHSAPFSFNIANYSGEEDSYIHSYSDKFPYTPQSVGFYADFYLKSELVLFGKVGYEFSKTLHHENAKGDFLTDSPYQGEIESGVSFEIGVAWRKRTARKFKYQ